MLPAYWPVRKFDLIAAIPNVQNSITAHHLLLFQCIAIALQMFMSCVSFVIPLHSVILLSC